LNLAPEKNTVFKKFDSGKIKPSKFNTSSFSSSENKASPTFRAFLINPFRNSYLNFSINSFFFSIYF